MNELKDKPSQETKGSNLGYWLIIVAWLVILGSVFAIIDAYG